MKQPELNEQPVQQLAHHAGCLDGGDENVDLPLVDEFNRLAGILPAESGYEGNSGKSLRNAMLRRDQTC